MERFWELSDAALPFEFDVHAMIFSEDAPELEKALLQLFTERRVNRVNERKEFFQVEIDEIEAQCRKLKVDAEFTRTAKADDILSKLKALQGKAA